jgi:hypothetical protein
MACLQRTFNPKYAHYGSDGSGRDTYILKDNGGLCTVPERITHTSSMLFKNVQYTTPHP